MAAVAGCAPHLSATPPLASATRPDARVPGCPHQRDTKKYAAHSAKLKTAGGSLCVPAFAGFGGTLGYPGSDRATTLTIRTSKQNIYNEPPLGSGSPLVYVNLHFHSGTSFGAYSGANGGITSKQIKAGSIYTAFGEVVVGHLALMFTPCYATAVASESGGVFPNAGMLFSNATITGNGYGVIEIYPGEQTSNEC